MRLQVEFEDIEGLRLQAGIDDADLREQVRRLRAGDSVRLTAANAGDPGIRDRLLVRITAVRGGVFRGSLVRGSGGRPERLEAGSALSFRAAHIHSVVGRGDGSNPAPMNGAADRRKEGATMMMARNTPAGLPGRARSPAALLTTEQRLAEIEELLKRVAGYAELMCRPAGQPGTSPAAREEAVAAFHERLASMERHLGRVHDEFLLG